MDRPVNLQDALASIDAPWSPLTVAVVNDYDVRVAKIDGDFTWHSHPETDELFMVLSGALTIEMAEGGASLRAPAGPASASERHGDGVWGRSPQGVTVELGPGDVYVVPRGRRHRPRSAEGATIVLFEPSVTENTGDSPGNLTSVRRVVER